MTSLQISGSKSESNRLLILQSLFGGFDIENLSNSQDTQLMQNALQTDSEVIDIHHAGTAMRFLTSYFAIQEGKTTILTGSERMKQRPISPLVDALRDLGADIEYLESDGFPPLKITGKKLVKSLVKIPADISSQFITSLILIGGKLENGLTIELEGEITSRPYLEMSLKLLDDKNWEMESQKIFIKPINNRKKGEQKSIKIVESDWSSASYFYSFVAISGKTLTLGSFKKNSLQGDAIISHIYEKFFGVKTIFNEEQETITLIPQEHFEYPELIRINMNTCPDIAQTLCVTATALKIPFNIEGLATLKVKETDRLIALHNELKKIGCETNITNQAIHSTHFIKPKEEISIHTYNDHRMAMAFAPYSLIRKIMIENPEVVEKSYPNFWKDWNKIINEN